jgi:hypothetical protein
MVSRCEGCMSCTLPDGPRGRQEFSSAVSVRMRTPKLDIRIVLQIGRRYILLRHDHGRRHVQGRLSKRSFRLGGIGTHAS